MKKLFRLTFLILFILLLIDNISGHKSFPKTRNNDFCDLDSSKCVNNIGVNVEWIAKPLSEALWAFAPDPKSKKISLTCAKQVELYKKHLENNTLWAVQMLDSSALSPSGILSGDNYQLGHFDQCLDINFNFNNNNNIRGQYCLPKFTINPSRDALPKYYKKEFVEEPYSLQYNPLSSAWTKMKLSVDPSKKQRNSLYWAICVPSSCTSEEIRISLKEKIYPVLASKGIDIEIQLDKEFCNVKSPPKHTTATNIVMLFIIASCVFVVVFSLVDLLVYRKTEWEKLENKGKFTSIMLSYSVYENFLNLTKPDKSDEFIIIHGMRTYTTMLVMLGHRCMFTYGSPFHNPEFLENRYRSFDEMFLLNGFLIVDTFFTVSGFLTCYLLLAELRKRNLNILLVYANRLLRILPLYIIVIAIYANILPLIGDGPLWTVKAIAEAERCQNNWWTNLLFINNYTSADICMFQSWFLTCDMHFFIIGPIVVYLLHKRPKVGLSLAILLLMISIVIPFLIIYLNKLDGVLKVYISVVEDPMSNRYFKDIYIKSHNRAGPYMVGILAAYLYYHLKKINFKFTCFQVRYGSALCATISLSSLLGAYIFYIPGREYDPIESALYASLHRITWSAAMSWIIITGGTSTFGIVSPVLCMNSLVPLSRLTYAVFLIHGLVQLYSVATIRVPEYIRFPKLFWMWAGDVTISFILALVLHLVFEAPITSLSKMLLVSFKSEGNKGKLHGIKKSPQVINKSTRKLEASKKNCKISKENMAAVAKSVLPEIEKKHL